LDPTETKTDPDFRHQCGIEQDSKVPEGYQALAQDPFRIGGRILFKVFMLVQYSEVEQDEEYDENAGDGCKEGKRQAVAQQTAEKVWHIAEKPGKKQGAGNGESFL
jgi:hypothetical protein